VWAAGYSLMIVVLAAIIKVLTSMHSPHEGDDPEMTHLRSYPCDKEGSCLKQWFYDTY
jgi:hypothetical protein